MKERSKEYIHLKRIIDGGKHEEALQVIDNFIKKDDILANELFLYELFKCNILYQQGLFEELIENAEQNYQESRRLGYNLLTIDFLLILAEALIWFGNPNRIDEIIIQCEELLKTQTEDLLREYREREANMFYIKGFFNAWYKNDPISGINYLDQSIKLHEKHCTEIESVKPLIAKAWVLGLFKRDVNRSLKIIERTLSLSEEKNYKFLTALSIFVKATVYFQKGDFNLGIKYYGQSISLFNELNNNFFIVYGYSELSSIYVFKGDLDKALEYAELQYEITKTSTNIILIAANFQGLAQIYAFKGEMDRSILFYEKSLEKYTSIDHKLGMAAILNNMSWSYRIIGDLERALESIEASIKLNNETGNFLAVANNFDFLIRILIDKGDIVRARNVLEQFESLNAQLKDEHMNLIYMFDKALVLKTSNRSRDRGKTEDLLKEVLEKSISNIIKIDVLLNLCELLLTELSMTNELEVLEEINSYTTQLLNIAEKSRSFSLFAEIYFLKAKLALIKIDMKTARRFLTQAQKIAERYGLNQLANKISNEHEILMDQFSTWESLKKTKIFVGERMKLAGLDKHLKEILNKSNIITAQIKEEQVTIHREQKVCLVCKGDVSGFMYTCKCDALYCENCARALTDLENVCWVCNSPIDISKPVKPFRDEKLKEKVMLKKDYKK